MEVLQRMEYLRRADLFESFSDEELARFAAALLETSCAPGTVLFSEGEPGREMFILLEGVLEVMKGGRLIASIQPVESVGEMALIDDMPRSATVRAVAPCLLLAVSADLFQTVALRPQSLLAMMRVLSRRIRQDTERLAEDFQQANILIHDMKNILSLFMYLDALPGKVNHERADRMIGAMLTARASLATMMDEALAVARHMARPWTMARDSLPGLLREMAEEDFQGHPDLAQRPITLTVADDLPDFVFNRLAIRRLVVNLVLNGAQASEPGQGLAVAADRVGELARVRVMDRGRGIPEELRTKIFHCQFTTRDQGTGLGLLSCGRIVAAHGGTIEFASEAGSGTTVSFYLPMAPGVDPGQV
ncbi:MAG: hypothetical protein COX17_01045 [Deltaproteobacteria bacterium CG23_combo_of_CG06-09_8_20_14_all_60_8]|nr:MAG: hypothetical protein AUK28_01605 [Desulfobacterales bacterium CG2_30_60_27]PIP44511.1 MAG: hypothetical protein COX17_01045 [Deltaproteobacteria bacterium CG23_combo_of_CG06-09_8_20_14_all_60_8]